MNEYYYLIGSEISLPERQLFLNKYYIQHSSGYKFIQLMQTENSKNSVNLARLITLIVTRNMNRNICKQYNIVHYLAYP